VAQAAFTTTRLPARRVLATLGRRPPKPEPRVRRPLIALCTLVLATVAAAQMQVQPIKVAPRAQPAPATQATQVSPAVDEASEAVQQEAPTEAIETVESLRAANKNLRDKNKALRTENLSLKERLAQFTTRGGSQVRAYCPTETTSRNTAGAEADCGATGYKCEEVSGLCHKTCSSSEQCAVNHTCNPCNNKCEFSGAGATPTQC
jgi:hypothetical protein